MIAPGPPQLYLRPWNYGTVKNTNTYWKVNPRPIPVHHGHDCDRQVNSQRICNGQAQEHEQYLQVPHSKQLGCKQSTFQILFTGS